MNIETAEPMLLYKTITGSKAYGLDLPTSDTDVRGIFLQPNEFRLGNGYVEQVNDDKNDIVYYELNRFINLLANNNPNIIENLFVSEDKILLFDERIKPLYDNRNLFLTKQIQFTFGGYAISQIKKARGLNKKIVNPIDKKRKTALDFCYIFEKDNGYMMLAPQFLKKNRLKQEYIGLSKMPNGVELYKMYYDWIADVPAESSNYRHRDVTPYGYKGILTPNSDDVLVSEIPEGASLEAFLIFNKNGYSSYCREYKEYWEWVAKRNPHRYNDNISHNQGYDGKNMMHCLRMLDMAIEIAEGKGVNLMRPNREWLLSVRKGLVSYKEIMSIIEEKKDKMDRAFLSCDLPDKVDDSMIHNIILQIRA